MAPAQAHGMPSERPAARRAFSDGAASSKQAPRLSRKRAEARPSTRRPTSQKLARATSAARADENVDGTGALQERGPNQAAAAGGSVGAWRVVTVHNRIAM